jgi:D,D-heptose 1,7-bisphosphate phosphatase
MKIPLQAAVFFDKDGTLVEDRPYNVDCLQIRLASDAIEATQKLHRQGFKLVIITNQAGIAKEKFCIAELKQVENYLIRRFSDEGVPFAGFYYCPHHPAGTNPQYAVECGCRKPQAGLLFQAANELNIDLERSWMVGDILDDIEAGHRAGCRAILVNKNTETVWDMSPLRKPEAIATDLLSAAKYILQDKSVSFLRSNGRTPFALPPTSFTNLPICD